MVYLRPALALKKNDIFNSIYSGCPNIWAFATYSKLKLMQYFPSVSKRNSGIKANAMGGKGVLCAFFLIATTAHTSKSFNILGLGLEAWDQGS